MTFGHDLKLRDSESEQRIGRPFSGTSCAGTSVNPEPPCPNVRRQSSRVSGNNGVCGQPQRLSSPFSCADSSQQRSKLVALGEGQSGVSTSGQTHVNLARSRLVVVPLDSDFHVPNSPGLTMMETHTGVHVRPAVDTPHGTAAITGADTCTPCVGNSNTGHWSQTSYVWLRSRPVHEHRRLSFLDRGGAPSRDHTISPQVGDNRSRLGHITVRYSD